jgi:ribosomal protein S18 acetylase RimI-like enzyme
MERPAGADSGLRRKAPRATLARMPQTHAAAIRRATRADLGDLVALEQATFDSDRISRAQWRRHIGGGSVTVLVSGAPANIHGAAVVFYRRGSRGARLYSLAVRADARGGGLGSALLAAAETDARTRGCASLRLEVRTDNPAAIALYARRGYVRITRLPRFYEDGADAWRYVKNLTPATS